MNTSSTTLHELAHRRNDGMEVTMFWDSASDRVTVTVATARAASAFEILVGPGEQRPRRLSSPLRLRARPRTGAPPRAGGAADIPDGTVWTGRYPVAPGTPPRDVVVRVRQQGWTTVEFDIEHAYGCPVGVGRGLAARPRVLRAAVRPHLLDIGEMMSVRW